MVWRVVTEDRVNTALHLALDREEGVKCRGDLLSQVREIGGLYMMLVPRNIRRKTAYHVFIAEGTHEWLNAEAGSMPPQTVIELDEPYRNGHRRLAWAAGKQPHTQQGDSGGLARSLLDTKVANEVCAHEHTARYKYHSTRTCLAHDGDREPLCWDVHAFLYVCGWCRGYRGRSVLPGNVGISQGRHERRPGLMLGPKLLCASTVVLSDLEWDAVGG